MSRKHPDGLDVFILCLVASIFLIPLIWAATCPKSPFKRGDAIQFDGQSDVTLTVTDWNYGPPGSGGVVVVQFRDGVMHQETIPWDAIHFYSRVER